MLNSTHKKIEAEKRRERDEKSWYKLMGNTVYCKAMDNLKHTIDVRLLRNEKYYLKSKQTSKPRYISQNIFDNNLVAICKNKITLIFVKPAYGRMCVLDLSKVVMHKFHHGCIKKHDNNSRLLFTRH